MQKLKAVAERLTGPEIIDRAPQPTGKTPSNQSWRAAAGGRRLREMLGMLGAEARRGLRRAAMIRHRSDRAKRLSCKCADARDRGVTLRVTDRATSAPRRRSSIKRGNRMEEMAAGTPLVSIAAIFARVDL